MTVREVLLLGNPILYEISELVRKQEMTQLDGVVTDLQDTLMAFRERYGVGRAIAAPQIGVMKRLVYMHVDEPVIFINPILDHKSKAMMEVWDDCLCFPELLVKVHRHKKCHIKYQNMDWGVEEMWLEDDLSELLQHEIDHLQGILAVSRAIDGHSFALRSQKTPHFLSSLAK
jgi:peptide deformylase